MAATNRRSLAPLSKSASTVRSQQIKARKKARKNVRNIKVK